MSSAEILARIGLTVELFQILCPGEHLLLGNAAMVRLFGHKIKVLPCSGRWWIVGLEGSAEEDKTRNRFLNCAGSARRS